MLKKYASLVDLSWLYHTVGEDLSGEITYTTEESKIVKRLLDQEIVSGAPLSVTKKGRKALAKVRKLTKKLGTGIPFDSDTKLKTLPHQISQRRWRWKTSKPLKSGKVILSTGGLALLVPSKHGLLKHSEPCPLDRHKKIVGAFKESKYSDKPKPLLYPKVYQTKAISGYGVIWLISKSYKVKIPIQEVFYSIIQKQYPGAEFYGFGKIDHGTRLDIVWNTKIVGLIAPCEPVNSDSPLLSKRVPHE